jgi:hypothetical protein
MILFGHTDFHFVFFQLVHILVAAILYAPVGMVHQPGRWLFLFIHLIINQFCCTVSRAFGQTHSLTSLASLIFALFGKAQTSLAVLSLIAKIWSCDWLFERLGKCEAFTNTKKINLKLVSNVCGCEAWAVCFIIPIIMQLSVCTNVPEIL